MSTLRNRGGTLTSGGVSIDGVIKVLSTYCAIVLQTRALDIAYRAYRAASITQQIGHGRCDIIE